MEILKPDTDELSRDEDYLPVQANSKGRMVCACDYELVKHDETTWKCTGGSHIYNLQQGDVIQDKFGNVLIKNPFANK